MTFLKCDLMEKMKFYFYFCERMILAEIGFGTYPYFYLYFFDIFYDRYFNCLWKLFIFRQNSLKNSNIFNIPNHSLLLKSWTKILFCRSHFRCDLMEKWNKKYLWRFFAKGWFWPKLVLAPILTFICIFSTLFYDRYFNC